MSIRLRLTAWYSGILAVMLLVLSGVIYAFVYINTYGDLKNRLQNQSHQVELKAGLSPDGNLQPVLGGPAGQSLFAQMYIYDLDRLILSPNMTEIKLKFQVPAKEDLHNQEGFLQASYGGNPFLIYQRAVDVTLNNSLPAPAVLQVAVYTGNRSRC